MQHASPSRDLGQTMLAVIFVGILAIASFWVLRPFLPALIWATMIVIATWPLMVRTQAHLWGRRGLAVGVSTLVLLLIFVIPLWIAISTVVENSAEIAAWGKALQTYTIPAAPEWVRELPLVGERVADKWEALRAADREALIPRVAPYVGQALSWFVSQVGSFGMLFVHFLLTILLAAILFLQGEAAALGVRRFSRRVAGDRGETCALLAAQAIRAVALGVMVTALVQSIVAGIGLAIAGIPHAFLFTAVAFIFAVIQIGSVPVLIGASIWLFVEGATGWGIAMIVWTIFVGSLDNFLRPVLIRRGNANLSLLLIFAGVIGGMLSFGIIGIFVGPAVLAVASTLLAAWIAEGDSAAPPHQESRI